MNPSATRPLSDSLSGGATADSEVIAKKRKIDEDIRNLYENSGTVIDDYEETEYGEEDYQGGEDCGEDYHCSDLGCSSEDGSDDCCVVCNGEFPMEDSHDEEDDDGIDEGDNSDQDGDEDGNSHSEDDEKSKAPVKEKDDSAKNSEGAAKAIEDREGDTERDEVNEAPWHPLFKPDTPRVILLSSDNQKLCVNRHTLSSHR